MSRRPHRPHPRDKPGATREQVLRRERFERARRESLQPAGDAAVLYGWHTVMAALQNPARQGRKLVATQNAARRLAETNIASAIRPEIVRPDLIAARLPTDALHQGLYAEADPLPSPAIE